MRESGELRFFEVCRSPKLISKLPQAFGPFGAENVDGGLDSGSRVTSAKDEGDKVEDWRTSVECPWFLGDHAYQT